MGCIISNLFCHKNGTDGLILLKDPSTEFKMYRFFFRRLGFRYNWNVMQNGSTRNTVDPNFFSIYLFLSYIIKESVVIVLLSYRSWCSGWNTTSQWRHNDHDGVKNHQPHGCLFNRLFRHRSKKTSKLRVTGLCAGNSPGPVNSPHKGQVTRKMFPFYDVN